MPYPDIDPIAFQIGPVAIRWYGIAFATTFAFGWWYINALLKRPQLWGNAHNPDLQSKIDDLIVYIIIGIILGGRLGHVIFYQLEQYLSNPLEIFAIWKGGMSFHGGLIGTVIAILIFAKRSGVEKWTVGDLIAACSPMGILLVRSANFVNGEIVGSPSDLPWAMVFPGYDEPRHPAMIYEALTEGLLLFIVMAIFLFRFRTLRTPGLTAGIFLVGYAVARIFCEFFKFAPHRMIFDDLPITRGMALSAPMFLGGAWLIVTRLSKRKKVAAETETR